jgi:S-methylmethionine-dependent homocysteine/selenocysteine methylase
MTLYGFSERLATGKPLLLDGATGTELTRRGVDTRLPLWSAGALLDAPDVVRAIHSDYIRAGAEIITTNTFRTHRRNLARAGMPDRARELTYRAVRLARQAIQQTGHPANQPVFIAGSMSPLEDCYSPNLVPPDDQLRLEHREIALDLAEAGCDLLLVETMNTIREAVIAATAALATGLPVCVSFVAGPGGRAPDRLIHAPGEVDEEMTLLSGEAIEPAASAVRRLNPAVVMVNCVPLNLIEPAFDRLRAARAGPVGLYANIGHADDSVGWILTDDVRPDAYARHARRWLEHGASIIGGCCGTTPDHIAALHALRRALGL